MSQVAIVNITSFGREFPEHIVELEEKIGQVTKMILPQDMSGSILAEKLHGFKYVLLGNYPTFDKKFFENNETVKLIARHGIGYNNIDVFSAKEHGVFVTNMPNEIEVDAVAEQAVALLFSLAKNVSTANKMVIDGEWNLNRERIVGKQIFGAKTGIIGFGNIGKRFAEIMKQGFANEILVYDPYVENIEIISYGYQPCDLDTLLKESEIISLHANLNDSTYHLIDEDKLNLMKDDVILINTARGDLIDEKALFYALEKKELYGFGSDVLSKEPALKNHPLTTFPNVVITPHSSIYNLTCMKAMNRKVMKDIYTVESGKKPLEIYEIEGGLNEEG